MAYREDPDLKFLGDLAKHSDLNELVRIITTDKDGKTRYTESLTGKEKYKACYPQHKEYWQDIAEEVQTFGAHTWVTFVRRKGVLYKEILLDVAKHMKISVNEKLPTDIIEEHLMMGVLQRSLDKMSEQELAKFKEELDLGTKLDIGGLGAAALMAAFQAAFKAGGFKSYQLTLIVTNSIMKAVFGKGLALAGNAAMVRAAAMLTGPVGWLLSGLLAAVDVAGPATRVTIPAVFEIALLRRRYQLQLNKELEELLQELERAGVS